MLLLLLYASENCVFPSPLFLESFTFPQLSPFSCWLSPVILAGAAGARGLINPFLPHLLPQTASHYVLLSCRRGKQIWEIYERKLRESRPDPLALILHHRGSICDKLIDSSKKTIKPNHEEKNRLRKPKQRREQGNQIYKSYFLFALPILHQILFTSRTRNT